MAKCDKCGHTTKTLYPYDGFNYCDTCINKLMYADGDAEYCREKQEAVELHGWDIGFCKGCRFRNKCCVIEYFNHLAEVRKKAAALLGRLGGSSRSEAKRRASRANGKLGGRPRKEK